MISSAAVFGPLFLEKLPLVGEVGEGHHPLRDRVAAGLVARDGQGDNEHPELGFAELAVGIGVDQRGDDVVAGLLCLALGQLHGVPHHLARRIERVVLGELGVVVSRSSCWTSRTACSRSSSGTPRSPAIACSGNSRATCSTKSPDPASAACAAMRWARSPSSARSRSTERGVNPRDTILRNRRVLRIVHHDHRRPARLDLSAAARHLVARHDRLLGRREHVGAQRHLADVAVLCSPPSTRRHRTRRRPVAARSTRPGRLRRSSANSSTGNRSA